MAERHNGALTEQSALLQWEAALNAFEAEWQSGRRPVIDDFLPPGPPDVGLLIELVHIELVYRLQAGDEARTEDYLARWPLLAMDQKAVLSLIAAEYRCRRAQRADLPFDEYLARFPDLDGELRALSTDTVRLNSPRPRLLRLNCPHCRTPVTVESSGIDTDVACPSCGSSFKIDASRTLSWAPEKLPTLGKFELLSAVGRGAFGTVYRARDVELDRIVAVKVPRSGRFAPGEDEDRFVREARMAAQLHHPGIVPVYEVGRSADSLPYIVTELVQGVTLADALTAGRFSFREAAKLCINISAALHHAHESRIVHRDLKPSNIMLEGPHRDHVRVMDFGLARRDAAEMTVTAEGDVLGTPAYMAPEQASGQAHQADRRADVYSLGTILYELLTLERPFRGNPRMLLHQVINDEPPSPRKFDSRLPRDLETICLKCLAKSPSQRYATCQALAEDLDRWLHGEPIHARRISRLERSWRWCRRHRAVASLSAALLVLLVTAAVGSTIAAVMLAQSRRETRERLADSLYEQARSLTMVRRPGWRAEALKCVSEAKEIRVDERLRDVALDALLHTDMRPATQKFSHEGMVTNVCASPDGRQIVFTDGPHVWIWDIDREQGDDNPRRFAGRFENLSLLEYTLDGHRVAAADADGKIVVWNTSTRELIHTLPGDGRINYAIRFGPAHETLASTDGKSLYVWDLKSNRLLDSAQFPSAVPPPAPEAPVPFPPAPAADPSANMRRPNRFRLATARLSESSKAEIIDEDESSSRGTKEAHGGRDDNDRDQEPRQEEIKPPYTSLAIDSMRSIIVAAPSGASPVEWKFVNGKLEGPMENAQLSSLQLGENALVETTKDARYTIFAWNDPPYYNGPPEAVLGAPAPAPPAAATHRLRFQFAADSDNTRTLLRWANAILRPGRSNHRVIDSRRGNYFHLVKQPAPPVPLQPVQPISPIQPLQPAQGLDPLGMFGQGGIESVLQALPEERRQQANSIAPVVSATASDVLAQPGGQVALFDNEKSKYVAITTIYSMGELMRIFPYDTGSGCFVLGRAAGGRFGSVAIKQGQLQHDGGGGLTTHMIGAVRTGEMPGFVAVRGSDIQFFQYEDDGSLLSIVRSSTTERPVDCRLSDDARCFAMIDSQYLRVYEANGKLIAALPTAVPPPPPQANAKMFAALPAKGRGCAITSDGHHVLLLDWQGGIEVLNWNAVDSCFYTVAPLNLPASVAAKARKIAISPDGRRFAVAGDGMAPNVWEQDADEYRQSCRLGGEDVEVGALEFSHDGQHLVTWSKDGTLSIWNARTGRLSAVAKEAGVPWNIVFNRDNGMLVTQALAGQTTLWRTNNPEKLDRVGELSNDAFASATAACFSPDGSTVALGYHDGFISLWSLEQSKQAIKWRAGNNTVVRLGFQSDGQRLIACDDWGWVFSYDLEAMRYRLVELGLGWEVE